MRARWLVLGLAVLVATIVLAQPTITVSPSITYPGGEITITIRGTDEETCAVEIEGPGNYKAALGEITLTNGEGADTFGIPEDSPTGDYTVRVTCTVSGVATTSIKVTSPPSLVGGEVFKDFTPIMTTLVVIAAAALIAISRLAKRK